MGIDLSNSIFNTFRSNAFSTKNKKKRSQKVSWRYWILLNSGCSVARLSRLLWEQEAAGSNPATPTKTFLWTKKVFLFGVNGVFRVPMASGRSQVRILPARATESFLSQRKSLFYYSITKNDYSVSVIRYLYLTFVLLKKNTHTLCQLQSKK